MQLLCMSLVSFILLITVLLIKVVSTSLIGLNRLCVKKVPYVCKFKGVAMHIIC